MRRALLAAAPCLALAALALASAAPAAEMPEGKWWKNPRVTAELALTEEQTAEIEKVFLRSRPKLIDLRADLEKKEIDLQIAMDDKAADRAAVEKRIEAVENSRAALQKTRALMILDMKQVLKPDQWERLVQMQRQWRERMQERRRMYREEGHPGPGPRSHRPD